MVHWSLFPTAIGTCGIVWEGNSVLGTSLPDAERETTERRLREKFAATKAKPPVHVREAIDAIGSLLEGESTDLSFVDCAFPDVEPLAVRIYALIRAIPPGKTSTYGAVAAQLGDPALARAVGRAMGRNPIPIIVPCHRIIGSGGKLVGFSADGGVEMKLKMLEIEGAQIGDRPSLFDDLPLAIKPLT